MVSKKDNKEETSGTAQNDNGTSESVDNYSENPVSNLVDNSNPSENHYSKIRAIETMRRLKQSKEQPHKKQLIVKEISRILTELEEFKISKRIIYFSEVIDLWVYDSGGEKIAKLKDLTISGGERFPEISHIVAKSGNDTMLIPWKYVSEFGNTIRLNDTYESIESREMGPDDILLGVHILDQQVVDVNGLKVIRVNDIALTKVKNKLAVVNIDIGARSMMRRVGYEKLLELFHIQLKDHPVSWNSIEPLTGAVEKIHLKVPCPRVSDLNPADVAELFDELSMIEHSNILKSMKSETAAKVILECNPKVQESILKPMKIKRIASILEKMPPNEAANIISGHETIIPRNILTHMGKEPAMVVQQALSYKEGTVARYMNDGFIAISTELTCATALDYIRSLAKYPATFYYIYVVDESGLLKGVLSLKQLIIADQEAHIKDIMITKVITAELNFDIHDVRDVIAKYDLMALPVVDVEGRMRGIVNIDNVLDVVISESKEAQ